MGTLFWKIWVVPGITGLPYKGKGGRRVRKGDVMQEAEVGMVEVLSQKMWAAFRSWKRQWKRCCLRAPRRNVAPDTFMLD